MKCKNCGRDISTKTYNTHIQRCKANEKEIVSETIDLKEMNIRELKEYAKENDYKGYTNLSKKELIKFLNNKE